MAPGPMRFGMMSGRPHGAKRLREFAGHNGIRRRQSAGNGFERHVIRIAANDGIGIEGGAALLACCGDGADVLRPVYPRHPGLRIVSDVEIDERLHLRSRLQSLHDGFEPSGPLRMLLARIVLEIVGMIDQAYLHKNPLVAYIHKWGHMAFL